MKCEECLAVIDEYMEGELGDAGAARLSAHVAACATCGSRYERLLREQRMYAQYLLDVEATPALWMKLQAGIEEVKAERASSLRSRLRSRFASPFGAPRLSLALASVLAVIAVGVTVGVLRYIDSRETGRRGEISQKSESTSTPATSGGAYTTADGEHAKPEGGSTPADKRLLASARGGAKRGNLRSALTRTVSGANLRPEAPRDESSMDAVVRRVEGHYLAAIAALSRDFSRRRGQLDPGAVAQLEQALAELDRTIEETRLARREHPDDPVVVQYMMTAYARKVDALRQLAGS